MKNYVINGRVAREEIASDICEGILTREDVEKLVNMSEIKSAFIGKEFKKKIDSGKWDKRYLEILPNSAVAEAFNEDYLYYLVDVAETVRKTSDKKKISIWVWLIPVVILLCTAVFLIVKSRS